METDIHSGETTLTGQSHLTEGFANRPVFTPQKAKQLVCFRETLVSLECGIKFPQNQVEGKFVDFCRNSKSAIKEPERLWENITGRQ